MNNKLKQVGPIVVCLTHEQVNTQLYLLDRHGRTFLYLSAFGNPAHGSNIQHNNRKFNAKIKMYAART